MKQITIKTGKVNRVETVDRGSLLYLSEEEWMERARVHQRPLEKNMIYMGVIHIALSVFMVILALWSPGPLDLFDLIVPVLWGGLGVSQFVLYPIITKRNRNPAAIPGLYENGIQLPTFYFIPYPEIGKIERKEKRGRFFKRAAMIHLRSKYAKKPGSLTDGWIVPTEFLGPGGMACLKERLELSRGLKTGTPQIIIYGPDGAKAIGTGMEPTDGGW